jgi:hypothetical protein
MDVLSMIPALWKLLDKKNIAINVTNLDNAITVSILKSRRVKRKFVNTDSAMLIADIEQYLQA